ncbi:hypothetical protein HUW51_17125 [Adhaeribacter swui]|uniref:Phage portal protein n=1 Tax=Adhaeribacter swui TaxID=2086471 RepID=A0A7G7GB27_9BACT|nr:hypothetical protein [Adhaeribacter swui]QNF34361.1 hypothetical protein HUW51_17125 [Adhaeribacter swui]
MATVNKSGTMAFSSRSGVMMKTNTGFSGTKSSEAGAVPTTSVQKNEGSSAIEFWGDDNLFPQNVRKEVEKNTILPTVLQRRAEFWYGGGIVYGTLEGYDAKNNEIFRRAQPGQFPDVDLFYQRSKINRYAFEGFMDLSWWANTFPELILSRDRKKINKITIQEAPYCRYSKADKSTGAFKYVYVNANWGDGGKHDDEYATPVPVLDPYADPVEDLQSRTDSFKYIYPVSIPSPEKNAYQLASWNSIRRSGWLEVAQAIPEFKKALFKNQLTIKYVVEVHSSYWLWKYKDWETKTDDERRKIISDELDEFDKVMAGTEGAGKSIMTTTITVDGETIAAFKVTAIDDKLKTGLYIEDSQEASSHIFTALGLAPTLMGISPGKGMGAGSGSDARVAFNNFISTSKFQQDLILEPLHLVRDYNGWDPNLVFRIQNPLIMTLDAGQPVQQETK